MRVVALFRVSTEKQADEGSSLEAQERAFCQQAKSSGWDVVQTFRGCESATQAATERKVLQQLLACVRDERVDAVWVYEQSRLSRGDELEVALLMRELKERQVKILINGLVRDLSSIDERFMVGIQSLVDRVESERIKERMARGKKERARQGRWHCGKPPFGYMNPPPGAPGRGTLQVVPDQARIVRRIFELSAKGVGDQAIATAMNQSAIPAPRGGKWGKSSVRKVLINHAYVGTSASFVWLGSKRRREGFKYRPSNPNAILVNDAHEAIVTRELWEAVHNRPKAATTGKPRMLTGLLYINGQPVSGDVIRGTAFYRGRRGTKGLPWLGSQEVDDFVWSGFVKLGTGPDAVRALLQNASTPQERMVILQEIEYLKDRIAKTKRKLDTLVDMRASEEITKVVYLAKRQEAEGIISDAEKELASLQAKAVTFDGSQAERVSKAILILLQGHRKLSAAQRRQILMSIVTRIDITAKHTGNDFNRDERGRMVPGTSVRWAIQPDSLRLGFQTLRSAASSEPAVTGKQNERRPKMDKVALAV